MVGSHWIWFPEGNPAEDAPIGARFFRVAFEAPETGAVKDARLLLSADDAAVAYINGVKVAESKDWRAGARVGGLGPRLRKGRNVLAIRAENLYSDVLKNPAGLIATLEIEFEDGTFETVRSDGTWKASKTGPPGWSTLGFDDRGWPAAMDLVRFGGAPWGNVGDADPSIGPQVAGLPDGVRVIYMLNPRAIVVRDLGSVRPYSVRNFDPVTGRISNRVRVQADAAGEWNCAPPKGCDHDWVLVMEPVSR